MKTVKKISKQEENESRRWTDVRSLLNINVEGPNQNIKIYEGINRS